ncbi:MAG TPA: DEAD/DEAH box helicase, partial [Flavobacteriales bacterium]|nr:DEAD/DEAH box helicase [Flavobacteriales bacterium]
MGKPREILERFWGFNTFRPLQEEIVQSVIDGHDTLALLPTGGGKSICFQVPALCLEKL